jgi:hypothetical protein
LAAAEFEIAPNLHKAAFGPDAVIHFTEAHRLDRTNWSHLRQPWPWPTLAGARSTSGT